MLALLIDSTGEIWDARSSRLRACYSAHGPVGASTDFLVRNLGFVHLEFVGDTCIVRAAPARVMYATFVALGGLISERRPRRLMLGWFDGQWHHEIFAGVRNDAAERLFALMCRDRAAADNCYLAETRSPAALNPGNALCELFGVWRETAGQLSVQSHPQLFHGVLKSKFVILDATETGDLMFAEVGDGLIMYRSGWARHVIGRGAEEQPDVNYGRAVAENWRTAFLKNEPQLHDIDAIVSEPGGRRNWRTQYSRIALPIRQNGRRQLLSASLPNPAVDLRIKAQ